MDTPRAGPCRMARSRGHSPPSSPLCGAGSAAWGGNGENPGARARSGEAGTSLSNAPPHGAPSGPSLATGGETALRTGCPAQAPPVDSARAQADLGAVLSPAIAFGFSRGFAFSRVLLMASLKPPARSRRRLDLARMKAKCRRIYPHDKNATWAEHLQGCSCWSCGNRRRSEGASLQERRAAEAAQAD